MKNYKVFLCCCVLFLLTFPSDVGSANTLLNNKDNLDKMQLYLLDNQFMRAINSGEQLLATYKTKIPPKELYYFLALAYAKIGRLLRAEDICNVLLKEYNLTTSFKSRIERLKSFIVTASNAEQILPNSISVLYQVGAFKAKDNANKLKSRLLNKGIQVVVRYEGGLYKVRIKVNNNLELMKLKSLGLNPRRVGDE